MIGVGSDRFVEALARLHKHAEEHHEERTRRSPPSIAISRQAGSRGAEVARLVGEELGWPVYDHELLQRISQDKGLHARLLERLDERHTGWLEEISTTLIAPAGGKEMSYVRSLLELFASLSEQGHCVIVGRGAAHVLPAETTLRVRMVAPRANRIEAVMTTKGLSKAEAERWIDRTDSERRGFVKHYFNRDVDDPMGCDLLLNTGRLSPRTCAGLIAQAARAMEARGAV
jgi:cytidylate kinase